MQINQEELRFEVLEDNFVWIGQDLHILLKDNQEWIFENAYWSDLRYSGLDYDSTEECVILSKKYTSQ